MLPVNFNTAEGKLALASTNTGKASSNSVSYSTIASIS